VLLLKILLAPALIGAVTLAGRKWGPGIAGWLLGLPLISGPVLLFLDLEQGPDFASRAARACLLGLIAWGAFCFAYAYACRKFSWPISTAIGWIAYFIVAAAVLPVKFGLATSFALAATVFAVMLFAFPEGAPFHGSIGEVRYELWWRMGTAAVIVATLTAVARFLGPVRSGVLTMFPAYTTIFAVFTHRQEPLAAVTILKSVTAGLYTQAVFFVILSLALLRFALPLAFAVALAGALLMQSLTLVFLRRQNAVASRMEVR
jgi:hypothetical protein